MAKLWQKEFMNEAKTIKNPSQLVLTVLTLDEHFGELKRLSDRISELELKSHFDFEQAEKMIRHFSEVGQAISTDIALFVNALNEARAEAELAAQKVSIKTEQLKARKENTEDKFSRFEALNQKVAGLNVTIAQFRPSPDKVLSEEERTELKNKLGDVRGQLKSFIEEAEQLKEIGREAKIKILEQNADSMRDTLIAVSKKIDSLVSI